MVDLLARARAATRLSVNPEKPRSRSSREVALMMASSEARLLGRPGPGFFRGVKRSTSELAAQFAPQEFPHVVVWQLVAEHDALRHT